MTRAQEVSIARCFAVMPDKIDIDGGVAKWGGEVKYIFTHEESRPRLFDARFDYEMLERLSNWHFSPDNDYIVISGNILAVARLTAVVGNAFGSFQALAFNAASGKYEDIILGRVQL